ncbi:pentapeptide repeat-containing protein [Nocardiopsis trehalosi]|uniref:pentapeptide repeat-containing protein n=1 Tax=Nocardiopsis trehalosi TaxID=109329 RepID=UPI001FDEA4FD|nr:pentapeptide repeat-containing protein [Nocardiopsis trehalosi]
MLIAVGLIRGARLLWLITAAWMVASAAVVAMIFVVWLFLGSPELAITTRLSPANVDAIATRAFAVVAGLGGVALLVIAYRRQRTTENGEQREVTRLFTERFTTAVSQLGEDQPAIRLGGVHALAHLADDAPEGREDLVQMVIDVLCAYLRMPSAPAPSPPPKNASKVQREEHRVRELEFVAFREVRHTIIRVIRDHLRRGSRWQGMDYDFTGAIFDGANLSRSVFSSGQMLFDNASFSSGKIDFSDAVFCGGRVSFNGTEISDGRVTFRGAEFTDGWVSFGATGFVGGEVDFNGSVFSGGRVTFRESRFAGGKVDFDGASFRGGWASFSGAVFSGGRVSFGGAHFTGGWVSFYRTKFSGAKIDFSRAFGVCPAGLIEASRKAPDETVSLLNTWQAASARPNIKSRGED